MDMENINYNSNFKIGMSGYVFNKLINLLKAINTEIKFVNELNGIKILTVDVSHVSMLNIFVQKEALLEYDTDGNSIFALNLKQLPKILDNDNIFLSRVNGVLRIYYNNMNMIIKELENDSITTPRIPDLKFDGYIAIETKKLTDFFRDGYKISDSVKFDLDNDGLILSCKDYMDNEINLKLLKDYDYIISKIMDKVISYYPSEYIYKLLKAIKSVFDIHMSFKNNYPMKIVFKMPITKYKDAKCLIDVNYYLAPREVD